MTTAPALSNWQSANPVFTHLRRSHLIEAFGRQIQALAGPRAPAGSAVLAFDHETIVPNGKPWLGKDRHWQEVALLGRAADSNEGGRFVLQGIVRGDNQPDRLLAATVVQTSALNASIDNLLRNCGVTDEKIKLRPNIALLDRFGDVQIEKNGALNEPILGRTRTQIRPRITFG